MKTSRPFVDHILEVMAPLGSVRARAMFGGYSLSLDGLTFALVADEGLYLKTDASNRPMFEAEGLGPFIPFPDKPEQAMNYHAAPDAIFEDVAELRRWVMPSLTIARNAAARKRPKKNGRPL